MKQLTLIAAAAFAMFGPVQSADASSVLTGSLTADYLYPDTATVYSSSSLTVGTPIVCPGGGGGSGICSAFSDAGTISASGLSITVEEAGDISYGVAAFNGIDFTGLTFSPGATLKGFSLSTNLPGLTASDVSFTANSIEFNAQGLTPGADGYFITLDLAPSGVPEPATWAMFLVGFGALGLTMRGLRRSGAITSA